MDGAGVQPDDGAQARGTLWAVKMVSYIISYLITYHMSYII